MIGGYGDNAYAMGPPGPATGFHMGPIHPCVIFPCSDLVSLSLSLLPLASVSSLALILCL